VTDTPNRQYESLTEIQTRIGRVRVWRSEASLGAAIRPDNRDIHSACLDPQDALSVMLELEALPRVSAIQITDENGNGVALYPDWS